jgi:hypothetical protein
MCIWRFVDSRLVSVLSKRPVHIPPGVGRPQIAGAKALSAFMRVLLGLATASAAIAGGFDAPEDAVQALEQAYIQKNADSAVAAMDFVEEGRQMLQKINPTLANDPAMVKQAAEGRELAFRNELRTKGFPEFNHLKCSFVRKIQIAPALIELTQQCVSPDGTKSTQDLLVVKSELGWRVTLRPPP